MPAPLLGVPVPEELGRELHGYRSPHASAVAVAVVLQVYDDPVAQNCVKELCRLYAHTGVRLVGVEAAAGPIDPIEGERSTDSIEHLIATSNVSAGVLALLASASVPVEAHGVDDMTLVQPSWEAMTAVTSTRLLREATFELIRAGLRGAQARHYPEPLARLRAARLSVYGERAGVAEQAGLAARAAAELGVELHDFPTLTRFLELHATERHIDARRAEAEQREFFKRVTGRVHGWYRVVGPHEVEIDTGKAAPLIAFWLEETGQSLEDFGSTAERSGREAALLACKQWYDSWLAKGAAEKSAHDFSEDLMRLALRLEIPYFDLRHFRHAVAMARESEKVKRGIDDEVADVGPWLVELLETDEAFRLAELEERLDLLYRALQLAVPPNEAEAVALEPGVLREAIEELESLSGSQCSVGQLSHLAEVDGALRPAGDFLRLSRQRSEHMVATLLRLMGERSEDRAVLVAGGFHSPAITRALEDHPEVSWSVLIPNVDLERAWSLRREAF